MTLLSLVATLAACSPTVAVQPHPAGVTDPSPSDPGGPDVTTDGPQAASGTPWLIVTDAQLVDADADGTWEEGEAATIEATLVNTRAVDHMWYPGIVVDTNDARVNVPYDGWLYGIFGRTTMRIQVPVTASAPSGTEVVFTLRATTLGCDGGQIADCLDPMDTIELRATIR